MINKLFAAIQAYKSDKSGATAIEYGLIAGGISLAIVAGVFAFGESLETLFDNLDTAMDSASTSVTTDTANITSQ